MPRNFTAGLCVVLVSLVTCQTGPHGETKSDAELTEIRLKLLEKYGAFKHDTSKPAEIHQKLSPDRRAVFDAITRALFVPILDKNRKPTGKRVVDFAEEVRGIWGVRKNVTEGRFMFRMSMRFSSGLAAALEASSNIPRATGGHVLLPVSTGGDDDPAFKDFKPLLKDGGDVITFREATQEPKLQISLVNNDRQVGEVDIDYDRIGLNLTTPNKVCGCHCTPSNSDVGSRKSSSKTDVHLTMFNSDVPYFAAPLTSNWSTPEFHCKSSY